MDEHNQEIKTRIEEIFPSPQVASAIVDIVVHGKKPRGWSRKSTATYYKEMYAKQMKVDVDRMLESGNRITYRYDKWCTDKQGMTPQTLYTRINQSIRYLCDEPPFDNNKYKQWYETVKIHRVKGIGVLIEFIPGLRGNDISGFTGELVEPKENMPAWKRELEEWIESDSAEPFCKEGIALLPSEIESLKEQFAQLTNFAASITSAYIKVMRLK